MIQIFGKTIQLDQGDKNKESKTTPNANTKISAYDRAVQLVTNDDNKHVIKQ